MRWKNWEEAIGDREGPTELGAGEPEPGRPTNPGLPSISSPSQFLLEAPSTVWWRKGLKAHLSHLSLEPQSLSRQGREGCRDIKLAARPTEKGKTAMPKAEV